MNVLYSFLTNCLAYINLHIQPESISKQMESNANWVYLKGSSPFIHGYKNGFTYVNGVYVTFTHANVTYVKNISMLVWSTIFA